MEEIELRNLILRGEDSTLQFKQRIDSCEKLARECVAFLNRRGGKILIGVTDDGTLAPLQAPEVSALNQLISNTASEHIIPAVGVDTINVPVTDGVIIVLTVPEGIDKPYQTKKGEFYIKVGADKRHVTQRDELRRLFQAGSHVYAEQRQVQNASFALVDISKYRGYYEKRFGEDAPEDDEELFGHMRRTNLACDNTLTLSGVLLFAKEPELLVPGLATTKAVWFKGVDRSTTEYIADRNIEGSLPVMYEKARNFLDAWNLRRQPENGSFNDNGIPLVDARVFEEILTNAYVHRDYFIPDTIKVFIFDDRIEIRSPGTLPNSLTLDEALEGNSRSRNPIIEKIGTFLMKYRGTGTGLRRAKQLCPQIQFDNNTSRNEFIVTIPFTQ
jgi:ATP-dependent DNA helicase RecG